VSIPQERQMAGIPKRMLRRMLRVELRRTQRFSKASRGSSFLRQQFGFKRKRRVRLK